MLFPAGDGTERLMTYLYRWSFDYIPLAALLHRRLVTLPLRVADEFLYARFGHTMINNLRYLGWPRFDNTFPVPEGIKPAAPECEHDHPLASVWKSDPADACSRYFLDF